MSYVEVLYPFGVESCAEGGIYKFKRGQTSAWREEEDMKVDMDN